MRKIRFQTVEVETQNAVKINFGHLDMWFPKATKDGRHISTVSNGAIMVEDWFFSKNFHKLSSTDNWRC